MNQVSYVGVVSVQVPTPALFCIALAMFLLTALFWLLFFLWWRKARKANKPRVQLVESVKISPEIFIENGRFMLQGLDWQWLADQRAGYRCPACHGFEDITLRLYKYVPATGKVFLIAQHTCNHPHAEGIATDPSLDAVGGK